MNTSHPRPRPHPGAVGLTGAGTLAVLAGSVLPWTTGMTGSYGAGPLAHLVAASVAALATFALTLWLPRWAWIGWLATSALIALAIWGSGMELDWMCASDAGGGCLGERWRPTRYLFGLGGLATAAGAVISSITTRARTPSRGVPGPTAEPPPVPRGPWA